MYYFCFLSIVVTVSFNQSVYSVQENDGPAQPVLVLSNPSSTDITVQVFNTDNSAIGECFVTVFVIDKLNMLQEMLIMILDHTISHFLLE